MAKTTTAKKTTAKKPTAKKPTVTAASGGRLLTAAERAGRTLRRAAKDIDKVEVAAKKAVARKRGSTKPKKDPVAEAARAKNRAAWKSQSLEANSVELSKHGALVDERARVRATTGMSWSNRKPR